MGYSTYHDMLYITPKGDENVLDSETMPKGFREEFFAKTGYEFEATDDCIKWYDCEKDMIHMSNIYPKETFVIYGDGEESDDYWKAYFHNGKSHTSPGSITYDDNPFEELVVVPSKLSYKVK